MESFGGFLHKAAKTVGYDSGPRAGGTRATAAEQARRENAALKLQSTFRGHQGRVTAAAERAAQQEKRGAAALTLQSAFRGNKGRAQAGVVRAERAAQAAQHKSNFAQTLGEISAGAAKAAYKRSEMATPFYQQSEANRVRQARFASNQIDNNNGWGIKHKLIDFAVNYTPIGRLLPDKKQVWNIPFYGRVAQSAFSKEGIADRKAGQAMGERLRPSFDKATIRAGEARGQAAKGLGMTRNAEYLGNVTNAGGYVSAVFDGGATGTVASMVSTAIQIRMHHVASEHHGNAAGGYRAAANKEEARSNYYTPDYAENRKAVLNHESYMNDKLAEKAKTTRNKIALGSVLVAGTAKLPISMETPGKIVTDKLAEGPVRKILERSINENFKDRVVDHIVKKASKGSEGNHKSDTTRRIENLLKTERHEAANTIKHFLHHKIRKNSTATPAANKTLAHSKSAGGGEVALSGRVRHSSEGHQKSKS